MPIVTVVAPRRQVAAPAGDVRRPGGGAAARLARRAALALLGAGLGACGSQSGADPATGPALPARAAGAYEVAAEGSQGYGVAFHDADGRVFIALSDDGDAATTLVYTRDAGGRARRVPAGAVQAVAYASAVALAAAPLGPADTAGTYDAWVGGVPARFDVDGAGTLTPGTGSCRLSGALQFARQGSSGATPVTLQVQGCGSVADGRYDGVAYKAVYDAPAAWHVVAENGSAVLDFLVYR